MRLGVERQDAGLLSDEEYVPGLGVVRELDSRERWRLAGEYAATHRIVSSWFRRICSTCRKRLRCEYGSWALGILAERACREWLR